MELCSGSCFKRNVEAAASRLSSEYGLGRYIWKLDCYLCTRHYYVAEIVQWKCKCRYTWFQELPRCSWIHLLTVLGTPTSNILSELTSKAFSNILWELTSKAFPFCGYNSRGFKSLFSFFLDELHFCLHEFRLLNLYIDINAQTWIHIYILKKKLTSWEIDK